MIQRKLHTWCYFVNAYINTNYSLEPNLCVAYTEIVRAMYWNKYYLTDESIDVITLVYSL